MELIQLYLRQRRRGICAFLLFVSLFAVSFWLYHIPVRAVIYPALLCGLIGLVFLAVDLIRVQKKHRFLQRTQDLSAAMITALPEVEGVEDADYQAIILALREEAALRETTFSVRYQDMVDYYTIWAHQIKTPIASMHLKLRREDTPLARKLSADLLRVEQYVEMVLAFLRLDSNSSDYVFREHPLDAIVRPAVKKFASEFIDRKLRLVYEPITGTVVTDEKWLSFVLEQVLSNALKYTQEGCIKIYLTAPMTLCVEDTGIGIAPEDLPRVFEKGYTGCNGRGDKRASGIGLYLCKRICKNLGVGITAQSQLGRGTVIRLDLAQYSLGRE